MAKGTIIVLSTLAVIAILLFGINLGKKIGNPVPATPSPTIETQQPTLTVDITEPATSNQSGTSTYTDQSCGYTFSYPGSYLKQKTANQKSIIYVDANDSKKSIAATCAATLPRPPVADDAKETVTLDGVTGTLYHDKDPMGNPRDDIFVKHPTNGMEIVIAGYGETFDTVRSTFRFIQ